MTDNEIFANEILCIRRRASGRCNGGTDCNTCDLLMNEVEIIEAYQRAMKQNDEINRQKAEIESLINGQETLQKHIAEKNAEIEVLQLNVEDYAETIVELETHSKEQKAEIERLKKGLIVATDIFTEQVITAKTDSIKEFAERLKTETFLAKEKGSVEHTLWIDEIDNLVKEMTDFKE